MCHLRPATVKLGIFAAGVNIDRSQVIEYYPPSNLVIHVGNSEAAGPASEPRWPPAVNFWIVNAVTPVTDTRCAYFWAAVRDYAVGDAKVDDIVFAQVAEAFDEDKTILQAQQRATERHGDRFRRRFQSGRRRYRRQATARSGDQGGRRAQQNDRLARVLSVRACGSHWRSVQLAGARRAIAPRAVSGYTDPYRDNDCLSALHGALE